MDTNNIRNTLLELLAIPSPCGFTDEIVRYICQRIDDAGIPFELTRRGTIRAFIEGQVKSDPARAIVSHVDTNGAMVSGIKSNGRIQVSPIGYWSSRFAEGSRAILFSEKKSYRCTLLPILEWGVSRDKGVESVPFEWENIELRLDEPVYTKQEIETLGIEVGNYVALDAHPEVMDNGYIVSRNLDNKAGVASVLLSIISIHQSGIKPTQDTYVIFTISENSGSGIGSAVLPEVSELVTIDFASLKPEEKSNNKHLIIASGDASGPYDFHLTAHLERLASENQVPFKKKYLKAFHSDASAALVAGHDVRTAVLAYGGDASHSLERTHLLSLKNVSLMLIHYLNSQPTFKKDEAVTTVEEFSRQITDENMPKPLIPTPDVNEVIGNQESSD